MEITAVEAARDSGDRKGQKTFVNKLSLDLLAKALCWWEVWKSTEAYEV